MKNIFAATALLVSLVLFACSPKSTEQITNTPTTQQPAVQPPATPTSDLAKTTIPVDPTVRIGVLENGLKYYIKKNNKPEDRAELRIGLNAGSILEDEDQQGLAHFVEHMAFNGSTNFKKNELVDYLESVGTKFGPDLNAYTSFDETVYMLQVRTDDEEKMLTGLTVLEDWAGGISFDHEEIDKERGVVISEWRSRLSPDQRMQQKTFPVMYNNSHYAKRLPIGKPEIIENAEYEVVKRFYKDWYRPNLMCVSVVGSVDLDMMENEIKTRFGKLKNPENQRERTKFNVPRHKETLVSIADDEEASFTRVRLTYKHDNIEVKNLEDYRSNLVRSLYNRMLNARLDELAEAENPPYTFAYSGYGSDVGDIDSYNCFAFCQEGGAPAALATLTRENERVLRHGFNASEMERMKIEMIKGAERGLKEKDKTESKRLAMRYVYNYLDNNPIPSPEQTLELYKRFIPSIKVEEINGLAKNWITEENRVVVITGPKKEGLAPVTEAEVLSILGDVANEDIEPYEDNVSDEPLIANDLVSGKITGEETIDQIDTKILTLSNGVRVYLKQTTFKNDQISMNAISEGGQSLYTDADYPTVRFAARVMQEAGLGNFDWTQLTKKLAGKRASVSAYIGDYYEGVNGDCSPDDLETFMQLVHLTFTAPKKDEKSLNSYISKEKSVYKNILSNPAYYFRDQAMKIKFNNNKRMGFPKAEDLDKIDLDRAHEIYTERFADADDFTFMFVGNFDEQKLRPLLEKYIGSLPSINEAEKMGNFNIDYVPGKIEKNITKGKAPKTFIDMTFHGDFDYNSKNKYALRSLVDVMKIKMRESMREDKGGVYGVRVSQSTSKKPEENYNIGISFNTEPAKADELIKTAMKDIKNTTEELTDESYLVKVKEMQRQSMIKDMKENRFWQRVISDSVRNGSDLSKISLEEFEKSINSLDAQMIQNAAKQYFDMDNFIQIVMSPEEIAQ